MSDAHRNRIAKSFGAASDYDNHARVQRQVADRLADTIASLPLPKGASVLELGCGTGFLTEALLARGIGSDLLVTDIAPAMLTRCRSRIEDGAPVRFAELDAERQDPPEAGQYDLICSSLALQWFDDPAAAVSRILGWLAPGGYLAFTTLLSGTFREWRSAHDAEGVQAGLRPMAEGSCLGRLLPEAQVRPHRVDHIVDPCGDARTFLRGLRAIGAATPAPGHRPIDAATMRRVMRRFDEAGASASYEVLEAVYWRQD